MQKCKKKTIAQANGVNKQLLILSKLSIKAQLIWPLHKQTVQRNKKQLWKYFFIQGSVV